MGNSFRVVKCGKREYPNLGMTRLDLADGVGASFSCQDEVPATVNHRLQVAALKASLREAGLPMQMLAEPMRWSEDFGWYLKQKPLKPKENLSKTICWATKALPVSIKRKAKAHRAGENREEEDKITGKEEAGRQNAMRNKLIIGFLVVFTFLSSIINFFQLSFSTFHVSLFAFHSSFI